MIAGGPFSPFVEHDSAVWDSLLRSLRLHFPLIRANSSSPPARARRCHFQARVTATDGCADDAGQFVFT